MILPVTIEGLLYLTWLEETVSVMDRLTGTGVGRATTVQERRDMLPANLPSKDHNIFTFFCLLELKAFPVAQFFLAQNSFQLHNSSLRKTVSSCKKAFPDAQTLLKVSQ